MVTRLDKFEGGPPSGAAAADAVPPERPARRRERTVRLPRYRSGYSRFVRLMKYALPLVAGLVVLLLVIWPELKPQPNAFRLGISDLKIATSGGQRVLNARFTGVDRDNRPFSVTAKSAVQASESKERVDLTDPKADVTLKNGSWVAVTAPKGVYWRERKLLDLTGGVDMFQDEGYEFTTRSASVDLQAGSASGDDPVHGQGPFGTINAEGFRILKKGESIVFTGKAHLVLYPKQKPGAAGK